MFSTHDERRISLVGGLILTILTLIAGLYVFSVMQRQTESVLSLGLETALKNKIELIEHQIGEGILDSRIATDHLSLIQNLNLIEDSSNITLKQTTNDLLRRNLSGLIIHDVENKEVISSGTISQHHELMVRLNTDSHARVYLLWDGQFILRSYQKISNQHGQSTGSVMVEMPLSSLTQTFVNTNLIGETGGFMLCAPTRGNSLDMDCFLRGVGGNEFKRVQRITSNEPLPMHYALNAQNGLQLAKDSRQESVVAAHSPMAYGLGAVLKIDQKELYAPITKQIRMIAFVLVILVMIGIMVFYRLMMPLVHKLVESEQKTKNINTELNVAKEESEQAIGELDSYLDAISKLNITSIADENGNIQKVNQKFCEVSGYSEEELLNQDQRVLDSKQHSKGFFAEMWETIARGHIWYGEVCNRRKDGTLYWVDSAVIPIKNKNNKVIQYLSMKVDITARKQMDIMLCERLKESNCIRAIRHDLALETDSEVMCQRILDHLIVAMQFPDITVAMIELDGKRLTVGKYEESRSQQCSSTRITVDGNACGSLEVFYSAGEIPILPEEQILIDTIANDFGRWLERKLNAQRIADMATHDTLTGLPNRHLLMDRLEQMLVQSTRNKTKMAVLFIDLDRFKIINDSSGHSVGDDVLKEVASRIMACVREVDTVARQGGDEFVVVLQHVNDAPDASIVAEKILHELMRPFNIGCEQLHIGASIGIAISPDDATEAEVLLNNSDMAMYCAKQSGRNNYQYFSQKMNASARDNQSLENDLHHALECGELMIFFQPIVSLPSLKLENMEVLLRWKHPKLGMVPPLKFIALAEKTGLIIPIGEWVLKEACLQIKSWKKKGYDVPRLAINLSAVQFKDDEFLNKATRILETTGVDASLLALEITESMLIDDISKVDRTLRELSKLGFKISIDDFGTGYSSLSYLKRLPLDRLKIDRSFVSDIVTDSSDYAIVTAIIAMANGLEMDVVAEGVENKDQLDLLMKRGCQHFQGYYFSKPQPAAKIQSWLKSHKTRIVSKKHQLHAVK